MVNNYTLKLEDRQRLLTSTRCASTRVHRETSDDWLEQRSSTEVSTGYIVVAHELRVVERTVLVGSGKLSTVYRSRLPVRYELLVVSDG